MEPQDSASRSLAAPLSTILLLVVAAGSVVLLEPPLTSSRPRPQPIDRHLSVSSEDVPARLWQDPFEPVMAHQKERGDEGKLHRIGEVAATVERLLSPTDGRSTELALMPVLVRGGGYPEEAERRVRTRQAVISALATAGYVPMTESTIGFFELPWPKLLRGETWSAVESDEPDRFRGERPAIVPYEWYVRRRPAEDRRTVFPPDAVLVLWLDSDALTIHPMKRIACLLEGLLGTTEYASPRPPAPAAPTEWAPTLAAYEHGVSPNGTPPPGTSARVRLRLIGPPDSAMLVEMLREGALETAPLGLCSQVGVGGAGEETGEETAPTVGEETARAQRLADSLAGYLLDTVDGYLDDGLPTRIGLPERAPEVHRDLSGRLRSFLVDMPTSGTPAAEWNALGGELADSLARGLPEVLDTDDGWAEESVRRWQARLPPPEHPDWEVVLEKLDAPPPATAPTTAPESHGFHDLLGDLEVYSPRATAEEAHLVAAATGEDAETGSVADRLVEAGKVRAFHSTVLRDGELARALLRELAWRGVDLTGPANRDYVVLISEWDTIYGRSLPQTFLEALEAEIPTRCEESTRAGVGGYRDCEERERKRLRQRVRRYSYLRGLDGMGIEASSQTEADTVDAAARRDGRAGGRARAVVEPLLPRTDEERERPAGPSQLDQVRRLADLLEQAELELDHSGKGEIRAIGVLGSDLYDKELVLQALHRRFPRVLFFTTDLDARLVHPSEYLWSRNLLIASSFGFSLAPCFQGEIPPFRDGYQTATYLAGLLALGDHGGSEDGSPSPFARWAGERCESTPAVGTETFGHDELLDAMQPRIYEVSRSGAYDLTAFPDDRDPLHRERRSGVPHEGGLFSLLASLLLGALLVLPVAGASNWLQAYRRRLAPTDRASLVAIVTVGLGGTIALLAAIESSNRLGAGEPFAVLDGISVWPTEFLRLLATVLSLAFLAVGAASLRNSERQLVADLGLTPRPAGPRIGDGPISRSQGFPRLWRRLRRRFADEDRRASCGGPRAILRREAQALWCARRRISIGGMRRVVDRDGRLLGSRLWRRYLELGRPVNRLVRILPPVVVFMFFGRALVELLGRPNRPVRGPVAATADEIVLRVSVIAFIVLVVFVVDATRLAERFVRLLGTHESRWPSSSCGILADERGMHSGAVCDLFDVRVVARVSEPVARLVFFPFVVLLVMIFSRLHFFDDWDWPASLVLIFLFAAAYVVTCGVLLRRAAETARRDVLERLRRRLSRALAAPEADAPAAQQLRLLVDEVERLQRGAFAPWTRHPILKALLLPFGGIGLVTLLDLLARFGN